MLDRKAASNRFIPACAGNTGNIIVVRIPPTVHPRVRGEHATRTRSDIRVAGSSPRARGTLIPPVSGEP